MRTDTYLYRKQLKNIPMDWKKEGNFVTVEEAVKAIKDNDNIVFGHAAGVPGVVPLEMVKQMDRLHNVKIFHMFTINNGEYLTPETEGHFRHVTNFVGGNSRAAIAEDRGDFYPLHFSDVPSFFDRYFPVDVTVAQVSLPDENGNCSFGISCDYTLPAARRSKIIIAEMNENMPYIPGDNFMHISQFTYIVENHNPIAVLPPAKITDIEKQIGHFCSTLIKDGDTLQLGIGAIPDAVLMSLDDKHDLGIHTEMFSSGVVDLAKKGVITGAKKTLLPGKMVATFLMGTKELYEFANNNPNVEMRTVDWVNDPRVIAQNDNMVSINSCIEVDLTGQVNSETIGLKQFSGTGGQFDYVKGASWSKGGRSIMAMPSTAAHGKASRIVPFLSQGAAVTTPRDDVDYVVTEYGIAHLKGASLKERAKRLIAIAHPDFRPMLEEEYKKRFKN